MLCVIQAKFFFVFSSIFNVEKYTVNVVDFMSVQRTCTVSRDWGKKKKVFYQKCESLNVLDKRNY